MVQYFRNKRRESARSCSWRGKERLSILQYEANLPYSVSCGICEVLEGSDERQELVNRIRCMYSLLDETIDYTRVMDSYQFSRCSGCW